MGLKAMFLLCIKCSPFYKMVKSHIQLCITEFTPYRCISSVLDHLLLFFSMRTYPTAGVFRFVWRDPAGTSLPAIAQKLWQC